MTHMMLRMVETPEIIADKLYQDPELHWIVMLVNNVTDRYHQWTNERTTV